MLPPWFRFCKVNVFFLLSYIKCLICWLTVFSGQSCFAENEVVLNMCKEIKILSEFNWKAQDLTWLIDRGHVDRKCSCLYSSHTGHMCDLVWCMVELTLVASWRSWIVVAIFWWPRLVVLLTCWTGDEWGWTLASEKSYCILCLMMLVSLILVICICWNHCTVFLITLTF